MGCITSVSHQVAALYEVVLSGCLYLDVGFWLSLQIESMLRLDYGDDRGINSQCACFEITQLSLTQFGHAIYQMKA